MFDLQTICIHYVYINVKGFSGQVRTSRDFELYKFELDRFDCTIINFFNAYD